MMRTLGWTLALAALASAGAAVGVMNRGKKIASDKRHVSTTLEDLEK